MHAPVECALVDVVKKQNISDGVGKLSQIIFHSRAPRSVSLSGLSVPILCAAAEQANMSATCQFLG